MQTNQNGYVKLAPREAQILRLLCSEAPSNKEIAARLGIATGTLRKYLDGMLDSLQAYTRGAILIWGLQHPEAMSGEWCEPTLHKPDCQCGALPCTLPALALPKAA